MQKVFVVQDVDQKWFWGTEEAEDFMVALGSLIVKALGLIQKSNKIYYAKTKPR